MTIALAPISFGPLQFRSATILLPVVLFGRGYRMGIAIGILLANLLSPFGWYDFVIMPIATYFISFVAYYLRPVPLSLLWLPWYRHPSSLSPSS